MWDVAIVGYAPAVLGLLCAAGLGRALSRLRGATLLGPWCWLEAVVLAITTVAILRAFDAVALSEPVRYLIAISTFCPLMALLGARRPQDRGWLFVVIVFWLILAMPAFEIWVARPGQRIEIGAARNWLILVLLATSLGSAACTHRWLPSAVAIVGQWMLVGPWLSTIGLVNAQVSVWGGVVLLGGLFLAIAWPPKRRLGVSPFDQVWFAYRDQFGGLWALRVAERMNVYFHSRIPPKSAVIAMSENAPAPEDIEGTSVEPTPGEQAGSLRLGMTGLKTADGRPAEESAADEECWMAFRNLLRRFVDDDWVNARLNERMQ